MRYVATRWMRLVFVDACRRWRGSNRPREQSVTNSARAVDQRRRPAIARALLCAWVVGGGWLFGEDLRARPQQAEDYGPADPAVEALVRDALRDRYVAGAIPDQGLLRGQMPVLVLREMSQARVRLRPEAMPAIPHVTFTLLTKQEARTRAEARGENVYYITIDGPQISGDSATLWLGVDLQMPTDTSAPLCCCVARGEFSKHDGQWRFVRWSMSRCA